MRGRQLINILFLLLTVVGAGPSFSLAAEPVGPIAILLSDSEDAYSQPAVAFSEEVGLPVRHFNLHGDIASERKT